MAYITETEWVNYYGFQRFPFDRPEAGNEEFASPAFLSSSFVDPDNFDRVFGRPGSASASALLFARRGAGKTACRVMVDYLCREGVLTRGNAPSDSLWYILSVPHTHFYPIYSDQTGTEPVVLHTREILRRAVPALANLLAGTSYLSANIKKLSAYDRHDLRWLCMQYGHYLTSPQMKYLSDRVSVSEEETASHSIWLQRLAAQRTEASPLDHLRLWASLMPKLDIKATYVLVDGVDELDQTAANPQRAYELVRPILTCLELMDGIEYLAFKFFLPDSIESLVMSDPAFRKDRGFMSEYLKWKDADLQKILRRRLDSLKDDAYRDLDRTAVGFDALCVPDIHGQIEQDIVEAAQGIPRQMMVLCGLMVRRHCSKEIIGQGDRYQLNREDFEEALQALALQENYLVSFSLEPEAASTEQAEFPVQRLIAGGETDLVEFKSSVRWDVRQDKLNKNLHLSIVKTLAGMLNSEGGTLLIGVSDDGKVLGLAKDLQTVHRNNLDGYQLMLIDLVKQYFGLEYVQYLEIQFEKVNDCDICCVVVRPSLMPVYLKMKGESQFWVRAGNSTRQLDTRAAVTYINSHWRAEV